MFLRQRIRNLSFVVFLSSSCSLLLATPTSITYQGSLKQNGALVNGTYTMSFNITNVDGSQVYWPSGPMSVLVQEGLYRVELTPINVDWANIDPYIQTLIGSNKLSPPEKITNTSYALMAKDLVNGAVTQPKISTGAVTDAAVHDVAAGKITGTLTTSQIGNAQVADANIATMAASKLTGPLALATVNALSSLKFDGFETLKILQIQQYVTTGQFSTRSTTFVSTNLTGTFTPKLATSKVLLLASGNFSASANTVGYATIARNNTNLAPTLGGFAVGVSNNNYCLTMVDYDSPATVSPINYTVQIRSNVGAAPVYFPISDGGSYSSTAVLIAIEIAQ